MLLVVKSVYVLSAPGSASVLDRWHCVLKVEKRKQAEKMKRDQLNDEYLNLIEKQRLYFKTVKDFQEVTSTNYHCGVSTAITAL